MGGMFDFRFLILDLGFWAELASSDYRPPRNDNFPCHCERAVVSVAISGIRNKE